MDDKIIVSLDLMGGSNAPAAAIEGALIALKNTPKLHLFLHGNEESIGNLIHILDPVADRYQFFHAEDSVSDDEQPIRALKYGKESSMRKAVDSVKEEKSLACVSSGNTGALMVMAKMVLGDLPGIKRPAIISLVPHKNGSSVVLDLGANAECDELNLFQFALMGNAYAKVILGKQSPSIGLLNVGVESIKGTPLQKKTHELLSDSELNYKGYVEGCDITKGVVDVVVVDGFTGNVMLKFGEGVIKLLMEIIRSSFKTNLITKLAGLIMKKYLKSSLATIDPKRLNGAMFIGVNGIVVKSHGSSDAIGVSSAIKVAYELASRKINDGIKRELKSMHAESSAQLLVEKIKKTFGIGT